MVVIDMELKNVLVVNGIGDGKFGVGTNITREDICTILERVLEKEENTLDEDDSKEVSFEDKETISEYAKKAVSKLYRAGIVNGMTEKEMKPKEKTTRAQMVKMVYLLKEKAHSKSENKGVDKEEPTKGKKGVKIKEMYTADDINKQSKKVTAVSEDLVKVTSGDTEEVIDLEILREEFEGRVVVLKISEDKKGVNQIDSMEELSSINAMKVSKGNRLVIWPTTATEFDEIETLFVIKYKHKLGENAYKMSKK